MKSGTGVRRVDKPWGYELIWAETSDYVGKHLHLRAGQALSLQYHETKDETIFVHSGVVTVTFGESMEDLRTRTMRPGEAIRLPPGTIHRMVAETDVDLFEASTPQLDDLVRLDDSYGRTGTSEP